MPATVYSVPRGRGKNAGLSRLTACGVSCRSCCRKGVLRIGSRSYSPEIDSAPGTNLGGRSSPTSFQRQLSIMAARWPPAEFPATAMRLGSPLCTPGLRHTQASARVICSAMVSMVTAGHSA